MSEPWALAKRSVSNKSIWLNLSHVYTLELVTRDGEECTEITFADGTVITCIGHPKKFVPRGNYYEV